MAYDLAAGFAGRLGLEYDPNVNGRRLAAALASIGLAAPTLALGAPQTLAAPAKSVTPKLADGSGLHVVSQSRLDSRLLSLTVSTTALPGPANVRILLPAGYRAKPKRRYPVLYLLHGTSGGAADWTTMGDAEKTTAAQPLIVVMPDVALHDDGGGWCTDWWNAGARGVPKWETFHIRQLIPWVDRNLRTIAARPGRAIAGLSQGGFCSMSYAARHPDMFSIALSYSGAPDVAYDAEAQGLVTPIINLTETALDGVPANSMFGDRATEEVNWADHDPSTLANNLRGMNLIMYTGNGTPGPLDRGTPSPLSLAVEAGVHRLTQLFRNRLQALAIPSLIDDYGPGTHSWPYWARDLRQGIASIVHDFAHPPAAPKAVTYTTADAAYSVFGWTVTMRRAATEFSTLERASARGFALAGSGSASVLSAPLYRARVNYTVTLAGARVHRTLSVAADRAGRLRVEVPLGPPNAHQQDTLAAGAAGTKVYTTIVEIRRAPPHR